MKKEILLNSISLLFLFTTLLGCSAESSTSNLNFITGQILMVNNEPFARVAIMTDTSVYLLDCPSEIEDTLYKNQGRTAKVYYNSIAINKESIKVLKVDKVEITNSTN